MLGQRLGVGASLDSRVALAQVPRQCCHPRGTFRRSILAHLRGVPAGVCRSTSRNSFTVTGRVTSRVHGGRRVNRGFIVTVPKNHSPLDMCGRLVHVRGRRRLDFHGIIIFIRCRFFPLISPSTNGITRLGRTLLSRVSVAPRGICTPSKYVPGSTVVSFYQVCRRGVRGTNNLSCVLLNIKRTDGVVFGNMNTALDSHAHLILLRKATHGRTSHAFPSLSGIPTKIVAVKVTAVVGTHGIVLVT